MTQFLSILSVLMGIISIIISIKAQRVSSNAEIKSNSMAKRSNEVTQSTSELISNLALLIKKTDDLKTAFELERNTRRLVFYTDEDDNINKALFWFHEHGNLEDRIYIQRAINSKCFSAGKNLKLAKDTIEKISSKYREK